MIAILRPASAYIVRIAYTRYSPETSIRFSVWFGAVYAHHGIPSLSSAGSQFQPKFSDGVVEVPGLSSTGSTLASLTDGSQYSDAWSWAGVGESAGPGSFTGA